MNSFEGNNRQRQFVSPSAIQNPMNVTLIEGLNVLNSHPISGK